MQISRIFGAKTTILRAFQTFFAYNTSVETPRGAKDFGRFLDAFLKESNFPKKDQFFGKLSICQNMAELVIVTLLKGYILFKLVRCVVFNNPIIT